MAQKVSMTYAFTHVGYFLLLLLLLHPYLSNPSLEAQICESIGHRPLQGRCPKREEWGDEEGEKEDGEDKVGVEEVSNKDEQEEKWMKRKKRKMQ